MKIAIMGAGLAGLSCAIMLEKHGIEPVIFEKRREVGDRFVNGEIFLNVLSRPHQDPYSYLSDTFGIYLQPIAHIGKLDVFSEHEKATLQGHLGFSNLRGRDEDSTEKQLARQVKSKIVFHSQRSYEELLEEYTHVVLASGDGAYAEKMHNYKTDLTVSLYGATLTGHFDRYTAAAWLDHGIAPKGYGYFIPLSETEANLVVAYPDYPENSQFEAENLWQKLYQRFCYSYDQQPRITDTFSVTKYMIGLCHYPRIGNTFFCGNCFGSIMPFLGFGQYPAILSGIFAAYDLLGMGSYEDLTKKLRSSYHQALTLRKSLEALDNAKLDIVVRGLNTGMAERLFNTRYDFLKAAALLLKPLTIL